MRGQMMISYRNINIAFSGKQILKHAEITVYPGAVTLVHGISGSGKTTLFYRMALVNTECDIDYEGKKISDKDRFRREKLAFVLQNNELISYLTVEENMKEYARISGTPVNGRRIRKLLDTVNLHVPLDQKCSLLSLGERERLCIACALSKDPEVIILDEPTASLDHENKIMIFELLQKIAEQGKYVIFSSHEDNAEEYADDIWHIENQRLICEKHTDVNRQNAPVHAHVFKEHHFMHYHTRYYRSKNSILMVLTGLFIILTVICSSVINAWYGSYLENTRAELFAASDRYLYITDMNNEGYADNDTESTELSEGYPVYPVTWMIGDGIPVIPYYEETDLRDRVYSHLASDEHGVWLSFRANEKTRTMIQLMPQTDFTFIIKGDGLHTQQLPVNGVLKQGVRSYMLEDNEMYIAVWHEDYEAMCKGEPIGRIVYYDSYEELVQAKEQFEAEGYTVNDEASSYEHVLEITAVQQTFYERIRIILLSISVLLLTGIHIFSVSRRIREYTILRMNGIPASCISKIICMEQVPACAVTFGLGMILSVILYVMGIPYFSSFALCCEIMLGIQIVILMFHTIYFHFYSMDRVLRD